MDNKLQRFKQTQLAKKRLLMLLLATTTIAAAALRFLPLPQAPQAADMLHHFAAGMIVALEIVLAVLVIKVSRALRNDEALKQAYLQQPDERTQQVKRNAFYAGGRIAQFLLVLAAMVTAYFNITAAVAMIAAFFIVNLPIVAAKVYFSRTL